jgi:uncharacterized delta-60 repeat protein
MPLVLRSEKGSQLTFNEMDGNFTYLEELSQTGSFTGSFIGDGSGLTGIPGVTPIATGSFATTGSNQFKANQTISGSLTVSGSISQVGIGTNNTFMGNGAGSVNNPSQGAYNTFIGTSAGQANTIGTGNIAVGSSALNQNILGDSNIAVGNEAGSYAIGFSVNTGATNSVFVGHLTQAKLNNETNQIVIGNNAEGNGSNTVTIGNSDITTTYLKGTLITSGSVAQRVTGSLLVTGSVNIRGGITGSSFTGSFVGDGSGLTGIPGVTPIATGSFATTGSNRFVGNQIVTGSLMLSSSAAIELTVIGNSVLSGSLDVSGSINAPGSGSYRDFINDRTKFRSIRGNGPGLFNIIEQGDTGITFAVSKITTNDLTSAITSNLSGANNGDYSDAQPTTSGVGRGARLMFTIAGGVVTSVRIFDVANGNNSYEEYGQPANRQGIGYKAGDTLTVASGTGGIGGTGNLVITLRPQDIETYLGHDSRLTFDYDDTRTLRVAGDIVTTTNLTIGTDDDTSEFYVSNDGSNSIVAGVGSTAGSDTGGSIVTGYYNTTNYQGTAVFGIWNTASEGGQTVIGLASNTTGIGTGAFIIGNGTDASTKSNLLVAQGSTVQVTGSLLVTGSTNIRGGVTGSSFTGSFVGDGSGLTGIPGVTPIATGSFATTGSNRFVGNQTITGSLILSSSAAIELTVMGNSVLSGSLTISGSTIQSGSVDVSGSINADGFELDVNSTTTIPALNTSFNLNLSGSGEFGGDNFIKKTLVLGDGKVLIAGRFQSIDGHTTNDIARLNSNGTIDTSFSSPIFGDTFSGEYYGYINTFVTQSDNKILVGGNFDEVSGSSRVGLARLNANGTLDASFAVQSWGSFGEVRDIAIQNDGKIVCVGYFTSGSRRINTNGTLDTSFNVSTGSNQPAFFNNDYFYSVALLDSGSEQAILIGGNFQQWGSFSDYKYLVKLNPSGSLDTGFAGTNLNISTGGSLDRIKKIKVTDAYSEGDNGYIYIAGRFKDTLTGPNVRNAGFARLNTTDQGAGAGAFDSTFRTYITGSDPNNPGTQYVNDFDFYDSDKILLGGSFTTIGIPGYAITSANRFVIVDQNGGGQVSNWSSDGLASTYRLNTGSVESVTLLPNDNVLVGGTFTSASNPLTAREGLASLKLTGFGTVTTSNEYSITANTSQLLVSSSNTYFSGNVNISGSITGSSLLVTGSANVNGFVLLPQVSASLNFANDTAAASGGVPLGGLYRSGSFIQIRLV